MVDNSMIDYNDTYLKTKDRTKPDKASLTNCIFKSIDEPSSKLVGSIIPLSCGHTGKLSDTEVNQLTMHLFNAGFTKTNLLSNSNRSPIPSINAIPFGFMKAQLSTKSEDKKKNKLILR